MRHPMMIALASVSLTGCLGPGADAVWLFSVGETRSASSDLQCQENFNTTECPGEGEDPESDWTYERTSTVSDDAFFGQILDGPSGEKVLIVDNEVYVGEKSSGTWRFEWVEEESSTAVDSHISGYQYTLEQTETVTTVFVVDLSGGTASGTLAVEARDTVSATESDVWVAEEVNRYSGAIFDSLPISLAGDQVNDPREPDCVAGDCTVMITTTSTTEIPFTAIRTDAGRDGFEGVEGAGQQPGVDD